MRRKAPMAKASLPKAVPATTLPVDNTGNATVSCPMLGNDQYGDCGPVMCAHMGEIRSYGQGKPGFGEIAVNQSALISQYETVSGGDNGTDEDMLVGAAGIWTPAGGGLAGDGSNVVVDHLDVDVTDAALAQYCNDQFYGICMAWSVPADFLNNFAQGTVWPSAATPDPNNGHYTPLSDVGGNAVVSAINVNAFHRLWTWGAWCWVSPVFIASVDPQCFITFSALQFSKATGYDSHGRHVSDQASKWIALGGNAAAVAKVIAMFPAVVPTPPPAPAPVPPAPSPMPVGVTLTEAIAWGRTGINNAAYLMTRAEADVAFTAALTKNWPK
jgi:hypothetical protein